MGSLLKNKSILVCDDEEDICILLKDEFESHGCTVHYALNGQDGLKILKVEKIDLVISDIRMPGGDGTILLKNARAQLPKVPYFFLMTGYADLTPEQAELLGVEKILYKPFKFNFMIETVSSVFKDL